MIKNMSPLIDVPKQPAIFCGQFYDDICCAGFLGDPLKAEISVLMLGLSNGTALPPIAAGSRVTKIVAVDTDETSITRSKGNKARLPPQVKYTAVISGAEQYLDAAEEKYDVIIVDLYTEHGYASVVFDSVFHRLLKSRLNTGGHLVFNGFGVPMNLEPFQGATPQAWLAQCLSQSWENIHYLPHRRNATFIIGEKIYPSSIVHATDALCESDQLFMDIMQLRLSHLIPIDTHHFIDHQPPLDFEAIDRETTKRWQGLLPKLSRFLPPTLRLRKTSDLLLLLDDPITSRMLQTRLLADTSSCRTTIALLIAGEVNFSTRDVSWLPNWLVDTIEKSNSLCPHDWLDGLLPYTYGVVIHGHEIDAAEINGFRRIVEKLNKIDRTN